MSKTKNIVVGVDGSKSSLKALEWAAEIAKERKSELTVLMAWVPSLPPLAGMSPSYSTHDDSDPASATKQKLTESIHAVLGPEPAVRVHPVIRAESAAKALIEASDDADLLVVGRRGRGGFKGLLLGSVSHHVAAHARCTVVVVR